VGSIVRNTFDKLLLAVATIAFTLSTAALLNDSLIFEAFYKKKRTQKAVARVDHVVNDVRQRMANEFTWFPISSSRFLHSGDGLFSGAQSEASVQFIDGANIQLAPESLIVIYSQNNTTNIELQAGILSGDFRRAQRIKINNQKIITKKAAKVRIRKGKKGKVALSVLKGQVDVETADKKKATVKENQVLEVSPDSTSKSSNSL
jgi:hypothetical protein